MQDNEIGSAELPAVRLPGEHRGRAIELPAVRLPREHRGRAIKAGGLSEHDRFLYVERKQKGSSSREKVPVCQTQQISQRDVRSGQPTFRRSGSQVNIAVGPSTGVAARPAHTGVVSLVNMA